METECCEEVVAGLCTAKDGNYLANPVLYYFPLWLEASRCREAAATLQCMLLALAPGLENSILQTAMHICRGSTPIESGIGPRQISMLRV
jgi:hypothetical protein